MKNQLNKLLAILVIATLSQSLFAAEKIVTHDATTNDKILTEATTHAGYPSSVKVN